MSASRRVASLAVLGVCLSAPAPAAAHRLDEYLQATRLSIDTGRVDLEIDLTAGVAVAPRVFAWMDADHDGRISTAEGEAYARELLGSVRLSVDHRPTPVTLIEIRVPPFRDMSLGVGTIQVRATARLSTTGPGRHQVAYVNVHLAESSVYLANALVPADPRIRIVGQRRDGAQHELTVDYSVADAPWSRAGLLLAGLAMAGVLMRASRCAP